MAKRAGLYKSNKRKKELSRQKKQEEKRMKRFNKNDGSQSQHNDEEKEPGELSASTEE